MLTSLRPLLTYEAQRLTTRRRAHVFRWLAIVLVCFGAAAIQLTSIIASGGMAGAIVGSGLTMLQGLTVVNYLLIGIAAIGLFASVLTNERESGTLPLLVVADMPLVSFAFSKWVQLLLPAIVLLVMEVPLLAGATFFGGVTNAHVVAAVVLVIGFLLSASAIGVMFSALSRTSHVAAAATFLTLLLVEVGPQLGRLMLGQQAARNVTLITPLENAFQWLSQQTATSTCETLFTILNPNNILADHTRATVMLFCWQLATAVVALGIALYASRRLRDDFEPVRSELDEPVRRSRRVFGDAVAWKEFRFVVRGLRGLAFRAGAYAGVSLLAALACWWLMIRRDDAWNVIFATVGTVATIDIMGLAAALFGLEQRDRTLSTLTLAVPWPETLLWRKVLGVLPAVLFAGGILVAVWFSIPSDLRSDSTNGSATFISVVAFFALWWHVTVLVSFDRPLTALAVAFMATMVVALVGLFIAVITAVVLQFDDDVVETRVALVMTYVLGFATVVAHGLCLTRVPAAASR